jgi:6-phosphogluconolactonase
VAAADPQDLAEQAGTFAYERLERAFRERGRASAILAGGSTPRLTHAVLADAIERNAFPLDRVSWFFGDERWVNRGDPQSNEGMARASLLGPVGAPEDTINSWNAGAGDPVECAAVYAGIVEGSPGPADIVMLGLGPDGHTASLFPGAMAHLPGGRTVPVGPSLPGAAAAVEPAGDRGWRLTLCPGILGKSRCVIFLVTGAEKAQAFRRATRGDPQTPGSWIRGAETLFFATREVLDDGGRDIRHA